VDDDLAEFLASISQGLTFYRQERLDGGVRTGVMLDGTTVLHRFDEPEEEFDPTLAWSIDVRCRGDSIPKTIEPARAWLLDHEELIVSGLSGFADHLQAGSDPTGAFPLEWSDFPLAPKDVAMTIAERLRELALHWREWIEALQSSESAVA
jgi:hypothetical protein